MTSGAMILSRTEGVVSELGIKMQNREIKKQYIAIVKGCLPHNYSQIINKPLKKYFFNNQEKVIIADDGKESITEFKVAKSTKEYSVLHVYPLTGRKHQIRVHLASIGLPIIGDNKYGNKNDNKSYKNMMLHSYIISVKLNNYEEIKKIKAPMPDYMHSIC